MFLLPQHSKHVNGFTCRSSTLPGRVLSGAPASLRARERVAEQVAAWSWVLWYHGCHAGPENWAPNGIVSGENSGKYMNIWEHAWKMHGTWVLMEQ